MRKTSSITTTLRRLTHHVARPVREDEGGEGFVVEPYRGYGDRHQIYLMGRVYRQPGGQLDEQGSARDLQAILRRLFRRGARNQPITARFAGTEQRVVTDKNGYFRFHLALAETPPTDRLWHHVELTLELPSGDEARAEAEVFVPTERARFVVISDIDDTVMFTGIANKAKMLWRLFAQGAESRAAFPGVAAFYRALHGAEQNPMLYVSRGPWSIYPLLETFFQLHRIPVGPVLFLRDWGLSLPNPLPNRSRGHKLHLIRQMLDIYPDLSFILIGDSGQHDPETYARVVREHPGRVLAIYIRNVSHEAARKAAIEELAQEVIAAGSTLLLASDTVAMAEHAEAQGFVPEGTIENVSKERTATQPQEHAPRPVKAVRRETEDQTKEAVSEGELRETLEEDRDVPPNTVVEAEEDRRKRLR